MSWKTKTTLAVALAALLCMCGADVCYMGQQPDPSDDEMRWVLPYPKEIRCQCTKILFGGMNTVAPPGAEEFFYTDTPLLFVNNHDTEELQALLGCKDSQDVIGGFTVEEATSSSQDHEKTTAGKTEEREEAIITFEQDQVKTSVGQLTTEKGEEPTSRSEQDQVKTTAKQLTTEECVVATSRSEQDLEQTTVGQLTTEEGEKATTMSQQDQVKTTVGQLTTEKAEEATSRAEQDQEKTTDGQFTREGGVATSRSEQYREKTTVGQLTTEGEASTSRSEQDQEKTTVGHITAEEDEVTTECMIPLGMKSDKIPDSAINASSYHPNHPTRLPSDGRLDDTSTWANNDGDDAPWIQVDLGSQKKVYGLITQGFKSDINQKYWVGQFRVQWGVSSLSYINDTNGQIKIFEANSINKPDDHVTIEFPDVLVTKIIRIEPVKSECFKNNKNNSFIWCMLRIEILGCELRNNEE